MKTCAEVGSLGRDATDPAGDCPPSAGAHDEPITILPYAPQYREDFKRLNLEWIERLFAVEPLDHALLSDPEHYYIVPGGAIFFAQVCGEIVGTCGVLKHPETGFELSKMGVTRLWRGQKIGQRLAETAIRTVQRSGAPGLFLETHSQLIPAIQLYKKLGFTRRPFPQGRSTHYRRADTYMVLAF